MLLEASSSAPRKSYDSVFESFEKMIDMKKNKTFSAKGPLKSISKSVVSEACNTLSDDDIRRILGYIDFTKLSQEALERSNDNKHIPPELWMKEILSLCSKLQSQLQHYTYASIIERLSGCWSNGQSFLDISRSKDSQRPVM